MNVATFVHRNRHHWKHLEDILNTMEKKKLSELDRKTLRELSQLYRSSTSHLAFAQTHYPETTLVHFLHQLVGRAHHQIYRTEPTSFASIGRFLRYDVPQAVRANLSTLTLAWIFFLTAFALGLAAVQSDPRIATLVLPPSVLDSIEEGKMWTDHLFSAVPRSLSTSLIFTNNITVAFLCFIGGMTLGLYTAFILFMNGFLLGVLFKLCADHHMLWPLFEFFSSHGFVEISVIIVAGASGFILARALLNPGQFSRTDALTAQGKEAVKIVLGCVPPLITVGLIEGLISPVASIPGWVKISLGLILLAVYWIYLLRYGKSTTQKY